MIQKNKIVAIIYVTTLDMVIVLYYKFKFIQYVHACLALSLSLYGVLFTQVHLKDFLLMSHLLRLFPVNTTSRLSAPPPPCGGRHNQIKPI